MDIEGAAGSEFVAVYRTTTAGRTWREVSHNDPSSEKSSPDSIPFGCDKSVAFTSPRTVNGGGGYIYATTDGGSRWHQQLSLPAPVGGSYGAGFTAVVASGRDDAVGNAVEGRTNPFSSVVYHSADGGLRWMKVRPPGKPRGYDVDIVTPRVWRLVAGRTVLGTDNAGRTWTNITANVALSQASQVLFTTPDVGWDLPCCGISDNVRHTSDGGRHWTTVTCPSDPAERPREPEPSTAILDGHGDVGNVPGGHRCLPNTKCVATTTELLAFPQPVGGDGLEPPTSCL